MAILRGKQGLLCDKRFYDVIDRIVHTYTSWRHPTQKFQNKAKWVCFGPLFFSLIRLIQLCDKKESDIRWLLR